MVNQNDVAIVGMSCRVAGASSPAELWENLVSSKDVRSRIDRFTGFYHPDGGRRKGLTNIRHAYTIQESIEAFDNTFFSIPPNEAAAMDVQQRLLLELTYEAFENGGIALENVRGTDTAVFIGKSLPSEETHRISKAKKCRRTRDKRLCCESLPRSRRHIQIYIHRHFRCHSGKPG